MTGAQQEGADGGFATVQVDLAVIVDAATRRPRMPWVELAEHVAQWRDASLLARFSFVRKPPGLRLRFQGPAVAELEPELAGWLAGLERRATIRGARYTVYEPETARFGGVAGLAVAHRWFDHDAAAALAYECLTDAARAAAPRTAVALVLFDDLVARTVGDEVERFEVWSLLAELVAPLPPGGAVDRALVRDCLARRSGPGGLAPAVGELVAEGLAANAATAERLVALATMGRLDIGVRAFLAAGAPFHWNRFGLPLDPAALHATVTAAVDTLRPATHQAAAGELDDGGGSQR